MRENARAIRSCGRIAGRHWLVSTRSEATSKITLVRSGVSHAPVSPRASGLTACRAASSVRTKIKPMRFKGLVAQSAP